MSCINDELVQRYIDGESAAEETSVIEKHILTCNKCAEKIRHQRRLAASVKNAINVSAKGTIEIPAFSITPQPARKNAFTTRRAIYTVAAASVILFMFVIGQNKWTNRQNENLVGLSLRMDVDANLPASQLPMVINMIDSEGNITEYAIE